MAGAGGVAVFRGSEQLQAWLRTVLPAAPLLLLGSQALKDEKERAKRAGREEARETELGEHSS